MLIPRALLLCALIIAAPLPLPLAPNCGFAQETDAPLEEQQTETQQGMSAAAWSLLRRQRSTAMLDCVRAARRGGQDRPMVGRTHPEGHRLANGLCAPLLR